MSSTIDLSKTTMRVERTRELSSSMDFSKALVAAKAGQLICRTGWNGKGMFVFMMPGSTIPKDLLSQVSGLPDKFIEFAKSRGEDLEMLPFLCMLAADGKVVNGWLASQTDMLADDWHIILS